MSSTRSIQEHRAAGALVEAEASEKLRQLTFVVLALSVLVSTAAMSLDLRFGLFGAAFFLGWTQLVGL